MCFPLASSRGSYTECKFEAELEYVEANVKTEVKLAGMGEDSKARSLQLSWATFSHPSRRCGQERD